MSERDLHAAWSRGPSAYLPGAWDILDQEVRRRGLARTFDRRQRPEQPVVSATPIAICPKCASRSVQALTRARGSATTAAILEVVGGTAAGVTAGRSDEAFVKCLACGFEWEPGSEEEYFTRALSGQLGAGLQDWAQGEAERTAEWLKQAMFCAMVVVGVLIFWVWLG